MKLLKVHRWISIVIVLFTLYLAVTGTLIALIDLKGLLLRASPYDVNLQALRGDANGPGDYAMIGPAYYLAPTLATGTDYPVLFDNVLQAVRLDHADIPLRYLELRQEPGLVVGQAQFAQESKGGGRDYPTLVLDATSGVVLQGAEAPKHNIESRDSLRIIVKSLHRMTTFGNGALWINLVVGAGLIALIVTGVWIYVKQYRNRVAVGRKGLFWKTQDWWRNLHRIVSFTCAVFLIIVAISGLWLAVESLAFGYYLSDQIEKARAGGQEFAMRRDAMGILPEAQVPQFAKVVLDAYHKEYPGLPVRAIRLRVFAGYPQGVVITGESEARQVVYNARTGASMRQTEPGYPQTGFPFGWQAHQWAKQIHNGSMFGMSGRASNFLAGLALGYLSVSGIVMYASMWRRRSGSGRKALFW